MNKMLRSALLFVVCVLHIPAYAGLFDDEEARRAILDLRQKQEELRQEYDRKQSDQTQKLSEENTQLKRSVFDLQNQLDALKADLAKLRGQNEVLLRDVSDFQHKNKETLQSFDERLKKLEPLRITLDGREFLADPSEKKEYETHLALFRKGDFSGAAAAFVDFLSRNPQSGYRPSVLFWLGNAQYATKDYKSAMANFRSLIATAPDHLRVPESLLAIANCQYEIKETKAARKTLENLIANHPSTEAASAAKERLASWK